MQKIFVLIFVLSYQFVNGQRGSFAGSANKPVCVGNGNYCEVNLDCCSRSCSNSSRTCSAANNTNQNIPNRFSADETSTFRTPGQGSTPQKFEPTPTCRGANQQCSPTMSCCAFLTCERSVCRDKSVFIEGTETLGYNKTQVEDRFSGASNETVVTATPANVKCSERGGKCYKESECCSGLRCHSFLHQCVV